jgi:outer membrane protein assembly factor BamA
MSGNDKVVEKLQYTGAYNFVRIKDSLREDAEGRSTLFLYTEEHVPGSLRSSLFYETQYGAGVSVDGRHSNVAGTLNEVRTGFSFASQRQTAYAGYGSPLTLGFLIRFDDDLAVNWYQDEPVLHEDKGPFGGDFTWTNSARLTFPFSYWLRLVTDAQLEAKSRMISLSSRERDLSLNFIQTALFTFVDQAMDPRRGVRFSLTWGNGGPLQKGDVFRFTEFRHNWVEAKTSQYYPFPLRMISPATRLDAGRFFGEGGPNSDRFFLGGSRSVRSYGFQHLCPMGPGDTVCVAQDSSLAYLQAGAELRVEPFWFLNPRGKLHHLTPLQVVPFFDFGKVWDVRHPIELRPKDGKLPSGEGYAAGLGARYPLLGIFNLRFDYVLKGTGGKIWRRRSDESSFSLVSPPWPPSPHPDSRNWSRRPSRNGAGTRLRAWPPPFPTTPSSRWRLCSSSPSRWRDWFSAARRPPANWPPRPKVYWGRKRPRPSRACCRARARPARASWPPRSGSGPCCWARRGPSRNCRTPSIPSGK